MGLTRTQDFGMLMKERKDWLTAGVVRNRHGSWDVVLMVDGSYTIESAAVEQAQFWNAVIRRLVEER